MAIIYLITNKINNKKYVGTTIHHINERWARHKYDSKTHNTECALHRAIRKYGPESFKREVIYENDNAEFVTTIAERHFIEEYESHTTQHGYNMTWGGDGWLGMNHSEETKRKLSETRKGTKATKETKQKLSKARKGKKRGPMSEETKRKISETKKGTKPSPETIEKIVKAREGYKHNPKTKEKISKRLKGQVGHRAKKYKVTAPNGDTEIIENMKEYCEEKGWNYGTVRHRIGKTYKHHTIEKVE